MSGIRRVANHIKYLRSNWMIVVAGFILVLAAILVAGSLSRAGGDVLAADYYQNGGYPSNGGYGDSDYYRNGGYPASGSSYATDYYKNGGYPVTSGGYYYDDANTGYYKNGGYPVSDKHYDNKSYTTDKDYYKNGGYPVNTSKHDGCRSGCGHTPKPTHKPKARYSCDSLRVTKLTDRQVRLTTRASTSGDASILNYRYEYGDGGVQDGPSSVTHTYNRSGTFTARAWVQVKVHGQQKWATSDDCTQTFTLKKHHECSYNDTRHCNPRPTPSHTPCACNGSDKDDRDHDRDHDGGYYYGGGGSGDSNQNANTNTNVNNNNSSANAVATANVTVKQAKATGVSAAPATAKTKQVSGGYPAVTELPHTGPEDAILGTIGLGSLVAAGTAYAASRRELLNTIFRR